MPPKSNIRSPRAAPAARAARFRRRLAAWYRRFRRDLPWRRTRDPYAMRELALALQPRRGHIAWTFNQALMELGALVCVARKPKCGGCPVRADCRWLTANG